MCQNMKTKFLFVSNDFYFVKRTSGNRNLLIKVLFYFSNRCELLNEFPLGFEYLAKKGKVHQWIPLIGIAMLLIPVFEFYFKMTKILLKLIDKFGVHKINSPF